MLRFLPHHHIHVVVIERLDPAKGICDAKQRTCSGSLFAHTPHTLALWLQERPIAEFFYRI